MLDRYGTGRPCFCLMRHPLKTCGHQLPVVSYSGSVLLALLGPLRPSPLLEKTFECDIESFLLTTHNS
jgi:hypothetical protein